MFNNGGNLASAWWLVEKMPPLNMLSSSAEARSLAEYTYFENWINTLRVFHRAVMTPQSPRSHASGFPVFSIRLAKRADRSRMAVYFGVQNCEEFVIEVIDAEFRALGWLKTCVQRETTPGFQPLDSTYTHFVVVRDRMRVQTKRDPAPDSQPSIPPKLPGPNGSMDALYRALNASLCPIDLSIILRPLELSQGEVKELENIRSTADAPATAKAGGGFSQSPSQQREDPRSRWFSTYVTALLEQGQSLFECFAICTIRPKDYACIPSVVETFQALAAPSSEATKSQGPSPDYGCKVKLIQPGQFSYWPRDLVEKYYAGQLIESNTFSRRCELYADARQAATWFRFPIDPGYGIPDVVFKSPLPSVSPIDSEPAASPKLDYGDGWSGDLAAGADVGTYADSDRVKLHLPFDDLCKHALVVGRPGSGKTTLLWNLLIALANRGYPQNGTSSTPSVGGPPRLVFDKWRVCGRIPFLVIEPKAMPEYRALLNVAKEVVVYTVGEPIAPFHLNPFTVPMGVRVRDHISALANCFRMLIGGTDFGMGIVLSALKHSYVAENKINRMTDGELLGTVQGYSPSIKAPLFKSFKSALAHVIDSSTYNDENRKLVQGVMENRLGPLLDEDGVLGQVFNEESTDPNVIVDPLSLFNKPIILETRGIGLENQAFFIAVVMMYLQEFLVTQLPLEEAQGTGVGQPTSKWSSSAVSYNHWRKIRQKRGDPVRRLRHLTIIEEANQIVPRAVESAGGASRVDAGGGRAVVQLMSQVRAFGGGVLLADQSPQRIDPAIMAMIDLLVAMGLNHPDDQKAVGLPLGLSEVQLRALGGLGTGEFYARRSGMADPIAYRGMPPPDGTGTEVSDELIMQQHKNRLGRN